MSFFNSIIKDLREKRLWPVAVALLVGIVAVPVVLAKPAAKVPVAAVPHGQLTGGSLPSRALPVVTVSTAPGHSNLKGRGRNPFTQPKGSSSSSTSTTSTVATTTPGSTTGGSTTGGGTGGTSTGGTGGTTTGGTGGTTGGGSSGGGSPIHTGKPKPTTSSLTQTESYDVQISITASHGGVNKIGSLERDGTLPNNQTPLLVELGVLKGGKRVLFAVQPGTRFIGPGSCTPGPIDCQVMSLGQNQIESIAPTTAKGVGPYAMFAITGITATHYRSASAANKARNKVSGFGRRLLAHSNSSALSLFPYKSGLGAIVDLRDLTIGGL